MVKDYIGYQTLTDAALRGVVCETLRRAEKQGLVGSHHFYITFKTAYPGVDIPDFLHEQYPDEMTIILQHQFWGLKVTDEFFEVSLSFRKIPTSLKIPFAALAAFADPGVQFGLQFRGEDNGEAKPPGPIALSTSAAPKDVKEKAKPAAKPGPLPESAASADASPGEVVSLDAFRRK